MSTRCFQAMGTSWALVADGADVLLAGAEAEVHSLEARLSRFRAGSAVGRLARDRRCADPILAEVVRVALAWKARTGGLLDPTLGHTLGALGYGTTFERVDGSVCAPADLRPQVTVDGDLVTLHGDGALDLGGIAKGWAVDRVARQLADAGVGRALVDGGGDLRAVGGPWAVGVGDDDAIHLRGDAVATSSTRRRAWRSSDGRPLHHVIDPRTGAPSRSPLDTATVRAPDATTADALATALLIDPEDVIPRLAAWGARALVRDTTGAWWTTNAWEAAA